MDHISKVSFTVSFLKTIFWAKRTLSLNKKRVYDLPGIPTERTVRWITDRSIQDRLKYMIIDIKR